MKTTRKIKMVAGLLFATTIVVQAATTPVTNGLYVELIADNLSLTNGASVDTWTDTQGNATLVKGNNDPLFVAANTNFNGHATINFNYNSQLVDTTLGGTVPSTENLTFFMVAKYNQVHNSNEWLYRSQTAGNSRLRVFHSTANYGYQMRTQVGSGGAVTPGNNTVNTDLRIYNVRSGSNVVDFTIISATNTLSATGGNGTGIALGEIAVGSAGANNNYADANIAEILVYDHALTTNEIAQVNAYLKNKYFDDGGSGPGPGLTTPVITSIDFSGGIVSVTATNLSTDSSCVLVRSDDLTGTFTPVNGSEITPTNQIGVLQDTNPPPANAFYKVESTK